MSLSNKNQETTTILPILLVPRGHNCKKLAVPVGNQMEGSFKLESLRKRNIP